ncbi:HAD family hydrolase [Saccharothrix coeruleofusca]|uniref:Hydrolase n=1 Tax=Saccharothrix coeruleofusca TaxID=33919 RepID=A0A918EE88_9PSEU|nr:HAD-IA family hydrolase [Saccharothrix coeruleofusca]GGP55614.1 hydrolase [Saccharothrix coeruleofusca]
MDHDSTFDAVLFDFSGTLFDDTSVLDPDAIAASGADLGGLTATEVVRSVLAHVDSPASLEARRGCDLSQEAHRAVWTRLIAESGPFAPDVVDAVYAALTDPAAWTPYPDTAVVLKALHDRGVRIGVLSNIGWDIRPALADAGVLDLLDAVVLSCEHGLEKPDPALFALACQEMGTPPGRTLYIGDDPVKDGAAVRAGLPVYLLPTERAVNRERGLGAVLRLASA